MAQNWSDVVRLYEGLLPEFEPMLNLVHDLVANGYDARLHPITSHAHLFVSTDPGAVKFPEFLGLSLSVLYDPSTEQFAWGWRDGPRSGELDRTPATDAFKKFVHLTTVRFGWFDAPPS